MAENGNSSCANCKNAFPLDEKCGLKMAIIGLSAGHKILWKLGNVAVTSDWRSRNIASVGNFAL